MMMMMMLIIIIIIIIIVCVTFKLLVDTVISPYIWGYLTAEKNLLVQINVEYKFIVDG